MIRRVICRHGATLEYEGIPTQAYTQRVFRCPVHNDTIVLNWKYHWRFLRVVDEGKVTRQFMPYWPRLHMRKYKDRSYALPYRQTIENGEIKSIRLGGPNLTQVKKKQATQLA